MTGRTQHESALVRAVGRSHVGYKRDINQDAFVVFDAVARTAAEPGRVHEFEEPRALLLAVSDGMGGAPGGEVASALVVETLTAALPSALAELAPHAALERAIDQANVAVREAARAEGKVGMGATLTAVLVQPPIAFVAEVGDSRAYLYRGGELLQLTRDQTQAQYLLDRGIDPEVVGIRRGTILQAIGARERVTTVVSRLELRADDLLLLCSDGLSSQVSDARIAALVASTPSLPARVELLVQASLDAGGRDNVAVVLASFHGEGFPVASEKESLRDTFQSAYPEKREIPLTDED